MRKVLRENNLLLAFSLAAAVAAFGCTTNQTHGAGEPYMGMPSVGPASPTSTNGTSVPTTPPPMTSSYRGNEQALVTQPHRLTPDEAALIMADHQPKVRVLGPADPGNSPRPYVSDRIVTGQVLNANLNPQLTVNSTLGSPGTPAITNGEDLSGASAAPVFAQTGATTPTTAAIPVGPGAFAGGTTTAATAAVPATTTNAATTTGTTVTAASSAAPATTAASTLNTNAALATGSGSVRVLTTNGKVTVTNVSSSGKSQ